jgi:hypothetical protein
MRRAFFILVSGCFIVAGCGHEAPPPKEEPPSEEWLKRQELAARAAAVEAALDQALVSAGRDDARALELVREARADLLSTTRRTVDPEHRRILIEAHRDLEPVEAFLEGVGEVNPSPTESDLEWLRETIVMVRVSLSPVSDGYIDKLYGRYESPRPPERLGVMGPVPPERKKRTVPAPETVPPEIMPEEASGESPGEPPSEDEGSMEPGG